MADAVITKRVNEKFAIGLRYSAPDLNDGETISSVQCSVSPSGLTAVGSPTIDGNEVSQVYEAGAAGTDYAVTFKVTISSGHIYEDTYEVRVR